MKVTANKSTEEVLASKKLYTGLSSMKVVALNPTMKELEDIGITPNKEPEYLGKDQDGKTMNRLEFHVEVPALSTKENKFITRFSFFIVDAERVNLNGDKNQRVNSRGQFTWQKDDELPQWFNQEGLRNSYIGEEDLTMFIKNWLNVGSDDECQLENPSKLAKGDLKELTPFIKKFKENTFLGLLGVKEVKNNYYQDVYTKCFGRDYKNRTSAYTQFKKALDNQYSQFKADYQNSFELMDYIPTLSTSDVPEVGDNGNAPSSPDAMAF